jgi:prophage regulatory protein
MWAHFMEGEPVTSKTAFGELPAVGFLRQKQILEILPFSPAKLWRDVKAGNFPMPIKLGPRTTAWEVSKIRQYLDDHSSESNS